MINFFITIIILAIVVWLDLRTHAQPEPRRLTLFYAVTIALSVLLIAQACLGGPNSALARIA